MKTLNPWGGQAAPEIFKFPSTLQNRYDSLHCEMIDQLERTAALENHWLVFSLLGWEHLLACVATFYLLEVKEIRDPWWLYGVLWVVQTFVALGIASLVRGRPRIEESPLKPLLRRLLAVFLLLCFGVALLNLSAGLPVFAFLPVLATLSSFTLLVLAALISRRFVALALVMFAAGTVMAHLPRYGFLIYGAAWLVVLQALGAVLLRKRQYWLVN
jgi:hypothetical protein